MGQDQLDKFLKEKLSQHQSPIDNDALWKSIQNKKGLEIEPIIKDKLSQYEAPIDSQLIWNNIAKEVTGQPAFSWIKIGVAVLFLAGALMTASLLLQDNSNINSSNIKDHINVDANSENVIYNNNNQFNNSSKSTIVSVETNTNIISSSTNENVTRENTPIVNDSKRNKSSSSTMGNAIGNTATNSNRQFGQNTNATNSTAGKHSNINNGVSVDNTVRSDFNNNQLRLTNESLAILEESINNQNRLANTDPSFVSSFEALINNEPTGIFGETKNALDYLEGLPDKDICFPWNKSVECYDYSPKKFHFSILAYTTADYYHKSLKRNFLPGETDPDGNYVDNRRSTQKVQISNRSGLLLKLMHKKGAYIKVGIEAGFLRERFAHTTRDTITEIIPDQLINIDIDMNGDTTFTYGNAPVTTISSKNWKVNNSHRTIGIPVLIGFTKKLRRFDLGMEIGGIYNFNRSFEGWLLGPPENPSDAKDYFTSSNDINITGGVNLSYKLNNRFNLVGLASFRRDLNTISNEQINGANQKNTIFGVGIGLEFKI